MATVPSVEPTNIECVDICYQKTDDASKWTCKLCEKEKVCDRGRAGIGNLVSHLKLVHKDEHIPFVQEAKEGMPKTSVQTKLNVIDRKIQKRLHAASQLQYHSSCQQ